MKGILLVAATFVIIIGGVLIYQGLDLTGKPEKLPGVKTMPEKILEGKKIAMVIAFRDFRDEEYFVLKEILEKSGVEIKTASNKMGQGLGADGGQVQIDYLISNVDMNNFDAVVFIGGPGCLENLDNENSYNLAKETVAKNKLLAAICVSPAILAKAGVLKGKKATVWSRPMDKSAIKILEENSVIYQPESVVVDGKIITANGPDAAAKFVNTLIENLK
jgi:protease I